MLRRYKVAHNGKTYVTRGTNAEHAFRRFANRPVFGQRTIIDSTEYRLEQFDADTRGNRWASFIKNGYRIICEIIDD